MKMVLSALAALGLASAATAASAATILDGDFNNTNAGFVDLTAGSKIGGVWNVVSGSVDLIGGYWQSPSGLNASQGGTNGSVDLDGTAPGAISQSFSVTKGKEYAVTFDLSGNPDGGAGTKTVDVTVSGAGGAKIPFSVVASQSHGNMGYLPEEFDFTATSTGLATLEFASYKTPGAYGPVIGDVGVSAVPETATWAMMLLGVGMIGAGLRMAGRKNDVPLSAV